jgi:TetR/AcrR family transcriptional repressor of uid operon
MAQQARALATRELIIRSAANVFATRSYAQATLGDVRRDSGVTQGALYFHFDSKNALAVEVIERQHGLFYEAGTALVEEDHAGLPAMIILSRRLASLITSDAIVRAGLRLTTESADQFVGPARKPYEDWIATAEVLVARAIADGDIPSAQDPAAIAAFVIATFTGVQSLSQARTGWDDLTPRLIEMWGFLLRGIGVDESRSSALGIPALLR